MSLTGLATGDAHDIVNCAQEKPRTVVYVNTGSERRYLPWGLARWYRYMSSVKFCCMNTFGLPTNIVRIGSK